MPPDDYMELQTTRIRVHKQDINITNTYIPPTGSCPRGYTPDISYLTTLPHTLLLGDYNAHHPVWLDTQGADPRGRLLQEQLDEHIILNEPDRPTRIPYDPQTSPTSPDISAATPDVGLRCSWRPLHALSSDHLPLIIHYNLHRPLTRRPNRTFTNYKRADWDTYTASIEDTLQNFDITNYTSIDAATKHFTHTITNADKRTIPTGNIRHYNPTFSRPIKQLIKTRNHLRAQLPTPNTRDRIQQLNTDIDNAIKTEQATRWKQALEHITFNTNPSRLWKLVRGLNNRYMDTTDTHEAILTNNTLIPLDRMQVNILNKHYARISQLLHRHRDTEILHCLHFLQTEDLHPPLFTTQMTEEALKRTKNTTSTGPDGISYLHLKHLGPHAIRALTDIFNTSIQHNTIPNIWKLAKIISILKPNKSPTEPASYRPISLLSNPSKILERLVLDNITPHIPLSTTQHGFRPKHSTNTLLTNITQTTLEGLNDRKPAKRTIVATIDISKAFDTVPRHLLIDKILNTHIHNNVKKWLANYLSGRHGYTIYNGKSSRTRHYTNGVPQGSVLSPTLFNLYMHDIPLPTHPDVHILSYADDLTIISQHSRHETASRQLQQYMYTLENWLQTNRLKVSANKSLLTLVTPYTLEYTVEPQITLNNTIIPTTHNTKILGVTLDRGMTFRQNTHNATDKCQHRLNVLRALTHTTYGHSKESITTLYKQYIRPILTYAHIAWMPDTAQTHLQKLQVIQNTALRIATGCVRSTPITHLHEETQVLPLKDHMNMRGTQIYTSTLDPSHPLHQTLQVRDTPRQKHNTPASHYTALHAALPPIPPDTSIRSHIHTTHTARALSSFLPNSLLGDHPPLVEKEEATLPRRARVCLARMRCGHHPALDTYMHRIGQADTDLCGRCGAGPGDVQHLLLHCNTTQAQRAQHNIQSLEHLWTHPVSAAEFFRDVGVL